MVVTIENYDALFFAHEKDIVIPHREIRVDIPDELAKELLEVSKKYIEIQDTLMKYFITKQEGVT